MYFFFNDTATTEIYTLSLHDALPISSEAIYRAATALEKAFDWPTSINGWEYWSNIDQVLCRLAKEKKLEEEEKEEKKKKILTSHFLQNTSREQILWAINALKGAFVWDNSPEGHAYWSEVNRKLGRVLDNLNEQSD